MGWSKMGGIGRVNAEETRDGKENYLEVLHPAPQLDHCLLTTSGGFLRERAWVKTRRIFLSLKVSLRPSLYACRLHPAPRNDTSSYAVLGGWEVPSLTLLADTGFVLKVTVKSSPRVGISWSCSTASATRDCTWE